MRPLFVSILTIFFFVNQSEAQIPFRKLIDTGGQRLFINSYGQLYILNQNQIFQYDLHDEKQHRYTALPSVNFATADVSDPFKIITLDANFNEPYLFDNKLNPLGKILNSQTNRQAYPILFARSNRAFYIFFDENKLLHEYSLNFSLRNEYYLHGLQNDTIKQFTASNNSLFFFGNSSLYILNSELFIIKHLKNLSSGRKHIRKKNLIIFNSEKKIIELSDLNNEHRQVIQLPDILEITDAIWNGEYIFFITQYGLYKSEESIKYMPE